MQQHPPGPNNHTTLNCIKLYNEGMKSLRSHLSHLGPAYPGMHRHCMWLDFSTQPVAKLKRECKREKIKVWGYLCTVYNTKQTKTLSGHEGEHGEGTDLLDTTCSGHGQLLQATAWPSTVVLPWKPPRHFSQWSPAVLWRQFCKREILFIYIETHFIWPTSVYHSILFNW